MEKEIRKPKNTETFVPSHKPADVRFLIESAQLSKKSKFTYQTQDIVVIPDLFVQKLPYSIYDMLLHEINHCGISSDRLWKLWHGDTHWIADDHTQFKKRCPTFEWVLETLEKYFEMEIKATRLNYFEDDTDWKPFHKDAAAINPEKAKIQNFTVGVSFGATRDIAFERDHQDRCVLSIPLKDGTTYGFTRDINIQWRHGVPQIGPNIDRTMEERKGRISIIAWGYKQQKEVISKE
jgi:hypothetical protein